MNTDQIVTTITTIAVAIISLATLSVILSGRAQTAGVIKALTGGLAEDIKAATGPIGGFTGGF